MRELDKSKVYDLSELNEDQLYKIHEWLKERNNDWVNQVPYTDLFFDEIDGWMYNKYEKVNNMTNAKELFYTLENIQVDCSELSKGQIKEMAKVFEDSGIRVDYLDLDIVGNASYLHINGTCYVRYKCVNKATITYDKFMELFGVTKEESEAKPAHYSQGIDTFARMEANCTKEECLAFAKGNIDKYNFRNKGQDVEDLKKIKQYADWALKIHATK